MVNLVCPNHLWDIHHICHPWCIPLLRNIKGKKRGKNTTKKKTMTSTTMDSGLQKYKTILLGGHSLMEIYLAVREEQPSVYIRLLDLPSGLSIILTKEELRLLLGQLKNYMKSELDFPSLERCAT